MIAQGGWLLPAGTLLGRRLLQPQPPTAGLAGAARFLVVAAAILWSRLGGGPSGWEAIPVPLPGGAGRVSAWQQPYRKMPPAAGSGGAGACTASILLPSGLGEQGRLG